MSASTAHNRLKTTSLESVEETAIGKIIKIGVPGPFYKDWISANFMPDLERAVSTEIQAPFQNRTGS